MLVRKFRLNQKDKEEKQLSRTYSVENDPMLYDSGFCTIILKYIESMRSHYNRPRKFLYLATKFKVDKLLVKPTSSGSMIEMHAFKRL